MEHRERRSEHRHPLRLGVEVRFAEGGAKGMLRCHSGNVGLGGIYLAAGDLPLETDLQVELVLSTLANGADCPLLPARVLRSDGDGCALSFSPLDAERERGLRRFLLLVKTAQRH